jgi:hypothetical protein
MTKWMITAVASVALGLVGPACSNDSGGPGGSGSFVIGQNPEINVKFGGKILFNGDEISVNAGAAVAGQDTTVGLLDLSNLGNARLDVSSIVVTSVPEGAFRLEPADGSAMPTASAPWRIDAMDVAEGVTNKLVTLIFRRPEGDNSLSGSVTIKSNDSDTAKRTLTFPIVVADLAPQITLNPASTVDFGNVAQGTTETRDLTIVNTGNDVLVVTSFTLSGNPNFVLIDGQGKWNASAETASGVTFLDPISIIPGASHAVKVQFSTETPDPATGALTFFSNDPTKTSGAQVALQANVGGPCITVNPKKIDFGGKLLSKSATIEVEIISCGDQPLEVTGIRLMNNGEVPDVALSLDFGLDLSATEGFTGGDPSALTAPADAPLTIPVNASRRVRVTYTPDEINPLDSVTNKPVPDLQFVEILSNTFVPNLQVEVRGFGVEVECPTPIIKSTEGEEVIPQTKLHLIGSQSFAATGGISKYEWTVMQPPGSQSVFLPSAAAPDPTFEVNVAGNYYFSLRVWDDNNTESCEPAEFMVVVNPDEAIHIELLWETPNDPDQTDEGPEAGADLDLHFLHPFATGLDVDGDGSPDGYFDNPFDNFWFNPQPDWGSHDPMVNDDPGLDRDDTDGAGPENVNLDIPEDGLVYRVGVHYWNDHGFGPSLATVRVYIMSVMSFQVEEVEMVHHDLWEVCTVAWPSGDVDPVVGPGGVYKIIPNYEHPLFLGQ